MFKLKRSKPVQDKASDPFSQLDFWFKICGILVFVFVCYNVYNGVVNAKKSDSKACLTESQISETVNLKMQQAISDMQNAPEFKDIKEFIDTVGSQTEKGSAGYLKVEQGAFIFIPKDKISDKEIKIDSKEGKFILKKAE